MLSRHDIEGYVSEGAPAIKRLRDSHHRLARLFAQGVRNHEIAEATGYSRQRVNDLQRDPMFQELVAQYREEIHEEWKEEQRDYYATANKVRDVTAQVVADWVQDVRDNDPAEIPIRTVMAIHDTFADRTGFGRKQTNVNLNVDIKTRLDAALRRTKNETILITKAEEGPPSLPQPQLVSQPVLPAPEPMRVGSSPTPFRRLK